MFGIAQWFLTQAIDFIVKYRWILAGTVKCNAFVVAAADDDDAINEYNKYVASCLILITYTVSYRLV